MSRRCRFLAMMTAGCSFVAVLANDPPAATPQAALDLSNIMTMVSGIEIGGPTESPPFADFKTVTKDMVSKEGLFILWHYPPGAKDKDSEKLLCQIPAGFLGEQFMLSTSFSGGGFFTGFPLDERVVMWELHDRQLVLVEPQTRFVIDKSKEVGDAVRRTYPDRIRVAVPVLTKAPNGDPVIDFGKLLKSDFADIAWTSFMMSGPFGGGGGINKSLSKWTKRKTFELNVEIGVELAIGCFSPPGSYDKKLVHYSFWKLPQTDYKPRVADDRVGYFITANRDWSKPASARDLFNRYVDRWHLVKRDPSLELCEPRHPIIFYIEKTVPVKYRRAVRDGILEWNQAFGKIGFVNAIEVRQQTADNEWKDLDPEDMRYSFFRWIVTGAGFAMGPHRANPFTGQIYDADIIFDDSMVRFYQQEAATYLPATAIAEKFEDAGLSRFLDANPHWRRPTREWEEVELVSDEERDLVQRARQRLRNDKRHVCTYAQGMKHQMALAKTILADQPGKVTDRFLYDVIKEVVTHEVGHTLGLRHNFKASTIYTLDEIQKRRTTDQATCGSVMDYNPALLCADNPTDGHFVTPTIGPYDYWAIEYGYRPFDGSYKGKTPETDEPKAEEETTEAAATESAAPDTEITTSVSTSVQINLDNIPPEILEQMPPEIRQAIQSGAAESLLAAAGGMPSTPTKASSLPKFGTAPAGETAMLMQIASRAAEPELAYATDEDTTWFGPDPTTNRFDMGADPVEWARMRIKLVDDRMASILEWAVKDQEAWYHLRQTFLTLVIEKIFVLDYVGRYIGGAYFVRHHKGDPDAQPPFVLVEPQRQRAALQFIEDTLFNDDYFALPPELLNHLAPARWWHSGARVSYALDFPIHDFVGFAQWWNLFDRLTPGVLRRIHDNELKTDAPDKLTVAEYLQRLQAACWANSASRARLDSGTWSDSQPLIPEFRRSLQREYLGLMEPLVRVRPGWMISPDLHAMIRHSLRLLADDIAKVADTGKADFASQAHLEACRSRIERMLSMEMKEY